MKFDDLEIVDLNEDEDPAQENEKLNTEEIQYIMHIQMQN